MGNSLTTNPTPISTPARDKPVASPREIDAALDDDIVRVASEIEDGPLIEVEIYNGAEATWIAVRPSQNVHQAITEAFGGREPREVLFGSNDVSGDASFDDHEIEVRAARCVAGR